MGLSEHVARPLRVGVAPLTTVVLFSILLAYVFVLYQPGVGPGTIQRLGWQAWEVIYPVRPPPQNLDDLGIPLEDTKPTGTSSDWWNVPSPAPTDVAVANAPLTEWLPLLSRDTGLSEISVTRCMFPPFLSTLCMPKAQWDEEYRKGGDWVRVDRDLNARSGFWYLNVYYRRTRRFDVPLVTNVTLLPSGGEAELDDRPAWRKVSLSVRDGVHGIEPLYLWYKLGPPLQDYRTNATQNIITELDVLYGNGPAWWSFEKISTPVSPGWDDKGIDPVWLTYRRGPGKAVPRAPPLHFNPDRNGTYKILQVADLHFSVGRGACRDVTFSPCTAADDLSATLLARMLDMEKPDLVVFTGDQLNGQKTSWDSKSVLAKFAREVIRRRIPWAAILGNHDDEEDMDRHELMRHLSQMPYSVTEPGPPDVDGASNYVLKIRSGDPSATHLLTLYFLDSGGYIKARFGPWEQITDYDYLRERQIDWFHQQSRNIQLISRPFLPNRTVADTRADNKINAVNQTVAKPNALMFFHIPIQETFSTPDKSADGKDLDVGDQYDGYGGSKKNAGFFEKAILAAMDRSGPDAMPEVKVVGHGHEHVNDNCRRVKGIWFCFGGGGSYAGYGRLGFDRRFRVYEISDYGETIRTYKHTEFDKIVDDMVLVGRGAL